MAIYGSSGIRIEGLMLRHKNQPSKDECSASVIHFSYSSNITVSKCDLNGCGSEGVFLQSCVNVSILNSHIHRNAYAGILATGSDNVLIQANTIEMNPTALIIAQCTGVSVLKNKFAANTTFLEVVTEIENKVFKKEITDKKLGIKMKGNKIKK